MSSIINTRRIMFLVALVMLLAPAASAQSTLPSLPSLDPAGFFESGVTYISSKILDGVKWALNSLVSVVVSLLVYVPVPHDMPTKDYWTECFNIYITQLLPLSLVLLGIYTMFSSEPPNRALFEGYIKRVAYATLLAFFSFTIIDTLVWFTNTLAGMIVDINSIDLSNALTGMLAGGAGLAFVVVLLAAGVVEAIFLVIIFLLLALRVVAIQFVAATMPIFCFFMIIGVGPLKRVSDLAEYLWGAGVILPVFSVIGAGLVKLAFYATSWSSITGGGVLGALFTLASFLLVLAYPFMLSSALGMFHTGMHATFPIARPLSAAATGLAMQRYVKHSQAFGKAAPLSIFMPSKFASWMHHRGSDFVDWTRSKLHSRLGGFITLPTPTGSSFSIPVKLPEAYPFRDRAEALAATGVAASSFGKLAEIAKRVDENDMITPDMSAETQQAFSDISRPIAHYAEKAATADDSEEMRNLELALSAVHGRENMSVQEGFAAALKTSIGHAIKKGDSGIFALAATISMAKDVNRLKNWFKNYPDIASKIQKSPFAKSVLSLHGINERDFKHAMTGDMVAISKISEKFRDFPANYPLSSTIGAVVSGGDVDKVASALREELTDIQSNDQALSILAESVGMDKTRLSKDISIALEGTDRDINVLSRDLSRKIIHNKMRTIEAFSENLEESLFATIDQHVSTLSKAESASKLSEFIKNGGYVVGQFDGSTAEHLHSLTRHVARERARQASWREHITRAVGDYHRTLTRTGGAMVYDPDWHYMEYKTMLKMRPPPISPRSITPKYM